MQPSAKSNMAYRSDIQILRAIAVILVALYHAKIPFLKSGFLGVDIFFVISGFLIGGIIIKETDLEEFSFRRFYLRRAWRLLPAAYVVFAIVVLISPLFLTQLEMKDLLWQAIGALTFTSNVVLWQQAGYFGGEASLKPLLHTWSLAIEEQFYIFLPLLLVSLRGKVRLAVIVTLTLLSFALATYLRESGSAAFYLLPTRAWELLLGVAVAIFATTRGLLRTPKLIYFGLFFLIISIPFFELVGFHPGPQAAFLCCATAIIRHSPSGLPLDVTLA
jgi:peptidoglycan/LPS O-acetylase OafA/YrhL